MNDFRMRGPMTAASDGAIQPGSEVVDIDGDVVGTVTQVDKDSFVVKRRGILGGTVRIRKDLVLESEEGHVDLRVSVGDVEQA
jgi:preprotein translocase subunit YajC